MPFQDQKTVSAKQLQQAVADLQTVRPGPGVLKIAICAGVIAPLLYLSVVTNSALVFMLSMTIVSIMFTSAMVTTHDALHHTLTGWRVFDEVVPRLFSWPFIWCHSVYAELHRIHHKMSGDDFNDPERVQWTVEEYERASPLARFYVRHQWFLDIFVFSAFSLIVRTFYAGLRYAPVSKAMRRAVWIDVAGMIGMNVAIYAVAIHYGKGWRWLLMWLFLERTTGAALAWRAHVEHYGLWGKGRHYFETQSLTSRNIRTNVLMSWFFNGLNYHTVHHVFPRVPFYLLKTAHERFQRLYADASEGMVEDHGYVATSFRLARSPSVIGVVDDSSPSRRRTIIPLADLNPRTSPHIADC